jgi:hypothetical protein
MKQKFEIKSLLTKKMSLDKRYYLVQRTKQFIASSLSGIIIGMLFGCYLADPGYIEIGSLNDGKQKIEVKAQEPMVTPTRTPNRRYQKYSYMPKYEYIISELQMLYTNWEDAADLQSYENGFDPMAINKTSGACGLSQALPCTKLPCELGDIKCDLKWQKDYISGRYGTVTMALQFHHINNWY